MPLIMKLSEANRGTFFIVGIEFFMGPLFVLADQSVRNSQNTFRAAVILFKSDDGHIFKVTFKVKDVLNTRTPPTIPCPKPSRARLTLTVRLFCSSFAVCTLFRVFRILGV